MTHRIGVDIGGTFTDFALFDDATGESLTHKQLTTPADPSIAVVEGVSAVAAMGGLKPADIAAIVHGTTLVTNAVIERKGVPTAMVVTEGFRDVLDIALERRYDLFDLRIRFPAPVVPRHLRFEVPERLAQDGSTTTPLDLSGLEDKLARAIRDDGIQAVAVCFLHSYVDDRHEVEAASWISQRFPMLAVSTSAGVFPFMREYERWTTACLNAYVQPVVDRYLGRLEQGLADLGFRGQFLVMSSSGGTLTSALARRFPVRLLESGPAAGALMSARHGADLGIAQALAFDMGGTTAKGCFVSDGRPLKRYEMEVARVHEFKKGSGLPVRIPVVDMIEIGAGGGSLAEVDERGTLRVGPRSAGADPGPACYGRGGARPTLTDANLLLGYLDGGSFLGGRMTLDRGAAEKAISETVAGPLGVDLARAAWGIHDIINEDVARAFRVHASERGVDHRNCSMIAYGGSGPLHAVRIARKLRIPRVVCPSAAGVMSAFGLLASPLGFERVRSRRTLLDGLSAEQMDEELASLDRETSSFLQAAGLSQAEIRTRHRLDMRYVGQGYEVEVELPEEGDAASIRAALPGLFGAAYAKVFGMSFDDRPVEIVNWKAEALGPVPAGGTYRLKQDPTPVAALKGRRGAYMPETGTHVDCPVYDRYGLAAGRRVEGPALIEERESTCVLGPGDVAIVDPRLNLVIEIATAT
jgi:N-methylhydantoinase A